jgi:hypothetical protein
VKDTSPSQVSNTQPRIAHSTGSAKGMAWRETMKPVLRAAKGWAWTHR